MQALNLGRGRPLALGRRCRSSRGSTLARISPTSDHGLVSQGFGSKSLDEFRLGIMGDLHLAPEQMHLFTQAREQIMNSLMDEEGKPHPGARICQLGDVGHSKHASGSRACFEYAREFMDGFTGIPRAMITGNHCLEGEEFPTDEDNLEAWQEVWQQPHHWAADLGNVLCIGLSTTRYRSNLYSHHEVYIDDEQMAWFEQQLEANKHRPIIILTHAPPQGCGLKVLQEVHVKNRCAWLNHSDRPERFIQLVERYPNIKLWASGHFHLSHNYEDSISVVGDTAFIQTGVIGECNRDGYRQSRLIRGDSEGYEVLTVDHGTGQLRLDLAHKWSSTEPPKPILPVDTLVPTPAGGWLTSEVECTTTPEGSSAKPVRKSQWFPVGAPSMLALQGSALVEYNMATMAPIGLLGKVPPRCYVRLLDGQGNEVQPSFATTRSDSPVAVVEVVDEMTGGKTRYPRNEDGGFYVIYQPNKWKLKQAKAKEERAARKRAAAASAAP